MATAGLLAAWALNDLEELLTMSATSRLLARRLPAPGPGPGPRSVRPRGLSERHVRTSIATVGVLVAGAAADGLRTGGRSSLYQNALLGFGLHGIGHLGVSVLAGGYTSGVATSPTVVIPFWVWATRTLKRAGVPDRRHPLRALGLAAASVAAGHLAAAVVERVPRKPAP